MKLMGTTNIWIIMMLFAIIFHFMVCFFEQQTFLFAAFNAICYANRKSYNYFYFIELGGTSGYCIDGNSSDFQSECLTVNTSVDSGYGTTHLQRHYIEDEGWCVFFYSDFLSMNVAVIMICHS